MKIGIIFTGGTIGSRADGAVISPGAEAPYELLRQYRNLHPGDPVDFVCREPYRILSENLSAQNLLTLIGEIRRMWRQEKPDGIIITHGTDTLQYSAAILGYIFAELPVPVVLVSAAYVLSDARSNGNANFAGAVAFIRHGGVGGVFVSYQNDDGSLFIHRGTRLQGPVPFSADLYSVGRMPYGKIEKEAFTGIEPEQPASYGKALFAEDQPVRLTEKSGILRLTSSPGQSFPDLPPDIGAVLLQSYHSGTLTADAELKKLAARAEEKQIPVFVSGLLPGVEYETVEEYRKLGILPLPPAAPISQYCRLWLALSSHADLMDAMQGPAAFDRFIL